MVVKYAAEWRESVKQFETWLEIEQDPIRKKILSLFCRLRRGQSAEDAAHETGFTEEQIMTWLSQYRRFGIGKVLGYISRGRLSIEQQMMLCERARQNSFESVRDAMAWVKDEWDIVYSYNSMRSILQVLEIQTEAQNQQVVRSSERWRNSSSELWQVYQSEPNDKRRSRLFALYLLRRGIKVEEVTRRVSLDRPTVERYLGIYREQGLEAI